MRAMRIERTDAGTQAGLQDVALDALTEGDVVIRSRYSSVNYKDALAVTGKGKIMRRFPLNAGIDVAGTVESSDDSRFAAGDEVVVTGYGLGEERDGGFAELVRVPADCVVPLPDGLSLYEAMGLGTAGFTAGLALRRMRDNHQQPESGPIVVTGATGGVGSIAVDLFSAAGYEVIAVTRKVDAAQDYLRGLGAAQVIAPDDIANDGKPLARAIYGGVVDNVGGDLLSSLIPQIALHGNVAVIGLAGGISLKTTVMPFLLRGVSLLGIHSVECPMPVRERIWADLAGADKPAHLDSIIQGTVGLRGLEQTCEAMVAGKIQGRTIVDLNKD